MNLSTKKLTVVLAAITTAVFILMGCKTTDTAATIKAQKPITPYQLTLYDNCPQTTYALKAQMWIKLAIEDYNGITEVIIDQEPETEDVKYLSDYVLYCSTIAKTISEGTAKPCTTIFNTKKDQSGITLDFSTIEAALSSLKQMTQEQEHEIYAFYIY